MIRILPYYEGLTRPGGGKGKQQDGEGSWHRESYWSSYRKWANTMILTSERKMKLHRRDRGKCLHAVNKESQGDFLFFFI